MELAKTRIQLQGQGHPYRAHWLIVNHHAEVDIYHYVRRSPYDCLKKIWNLEGGRGVLRGFGITVLRDCPSYGIYFGVYMGAIERFSPSGSHNLTTAQILIAGGVAGVSSWLFTYPIDVIKSRIQADGVDPSRPKYTGIADCFRKTYAEHGWKSLTKGLGIAVVRAFVHNAVTFFVFEWMSRLCNGCLLPKYNLE